MKDFLCKDCSDGVGISKKKNLNAVDIENLINEEEK